MGQRYNTTALDYQDYYRALKWGGVEIERVYLEWLAHPLFNLRGGIFLTPYGIWNVDHGSPAIIPILRPATIGNGYIPERQTGLEVFGTLELTNTETLEHRTV